MSKKHLKGICIVCLFFVVLGAAAGGWLSSSRSPGPEFKTAIAIYEKALGESFDTASTGPEFIPALEAFRRVPWHDAKYSLAQTFIREIEAGRALVADDEIIAEEAMVMIYTTASCSYCRQAKGWLEAREVNYVEVDVSETSDALQRMRRKASLNNVRLTGVPIIEIEDDLLQGFSPENLERSLARHGYLKAL
jgi:glutaredoxin 3